MTKRRIRLRSRLAKIAVWGLLSLVLLVSLLGGWAYHRVSSSLPKYDGQVVVTGIRETVTIERDKQGIPTIRAKNRVDLSFAIGYAHGQDRFFQMDLLRRNAAGELAELIGKSVVARDKSTRRHQFRRAAQRRIAIEQPETIRILQAYTEGVNAGLESLRDSPFEYAFLGQDPQPWKAEDCLLVVFSMFLDLQGGQFESEVQRGLFQDLVPEETFRFFFARGGKWDAPIQGEPIAIPPIPGPDQFDPRTVPTASKKDGTKVVSREWEQPYVLGSNNWAISGRHTASGHAIVANDMHLRIQVPHIWYRASFIQPDETDPNTNLQVTGVTLPGTPAMIVGSNGHIAWGFTNSEADWVDVVIVERDPMDSTKYLTPDGSKQFEIEHETIKVRGAKDEVVAIESTIWGPVLQKDHRDRPLACRWVAYDPEGTNLGLLELESCKTLEESLDIANRSGTPHQNFVVADDRGRIAWTIMGRIPRRIGHDGFTPRSWRDGVSRWDGYLSPQDYPRIVDPEEGRLWTANARVVGGEFYKIVGDSGYDRGARQMQIRDSLRAMEKPDEAAMLQLQLDDRALFLQPWRDLLVSLLKKSAEKENSREREILAKIEAWDGRAKIDSFGYRFVWTFRNQVTNALNRFLGRIGVNADEKFSLIRHRRIEEPFWKILEERPIHFLDPEFRDWDAFLLAQVAEVVKEATSDGRKLDSFVWGEINTTKIQHPLSMAVPALSRVLDMKQRPLSGAWSDVPKIQGVMSGASQRMAVSPGQENKGFMHMPCGQSGNPLSPHYSDGHRDWEEGSPTPFLPGKREFTLTLLPASVSM